MVKKAFIVFLLLVLGYGAYIIFSLLSLPSVEELKNRKMSISIKVKDWKGKYRPYVLGPRNRYWTPSASIPPEMKWAVILAEDANFYKHEGIDIKAIKNAIMYDLEKKSLARGASTITQQVAKNIFLTREKTITRKIKEVILAKRMEQELTKGRIVELYLNVVELGPMVYGIGHGARYYFGKSAVELTPRECAFLAAMLPGPRVAYNPYKNLAKVTKRSEMILRLLRKNGVLSDIEYQAALAEVPNVGRLQKKVDETIKKAEIFTTVTSAGAVPTGGPGDQQDSTLQGPPEPVKDGLVESTERPATPTPEEPPPTGDLEQ